MSEPDLQRAVSRPLPTPVPSARRAWTDLPERVAPHFARLAPDERRALRGIVLADVLSEYDARFLSAYLRGLEIDFTPTFRAVERVWALDEERHFRVFEGVFQACWESPRGELEVRAPDFGPLRHLFEDEFSILVLCAYDELATVRAYRANVPLYDRLGPEFGAWVRAVIADEAWHYSRFLDALLREHPSRLEEAPAAIARVRATEGVSYAATFVLDHDDAVFTEAIFDEAARLLERQLLRGPRADGARAGRAGEAEAVPPARARAGPPESELAGVS